MMRAYSSAADTEGAQLPFALVLQLLYLAAVKYFQIPASGQIWFKQDFNDEILLEKGTMSC